MLFEGVSFFCRFTTLHLSLKTASMGDKPTDNFKHHYYPRNLPNQLARNMLVFSAMLSQIGWKLVTRNVTIKTIYNFY